MLKTLSPKRTSREVKDWTDELVLFCVRADFNDEKSANELSQILSNKIDWQKAISNLIFHRLIPLLTRFVDSYNLRDRVPTDIFSKLRQEWFASVAYTLILDDALKSLLKLFSDAGIPIVVMKGAFLNSHIYQFKDTRYYNDLDILVGPEDLENARKLLQSRGYLPVYSGLNLPWRKPNAAFSFIYRKSGAYIELQHTIVNNKCYWESTNVDLGELWGYTRDLSILGQQAREMRPEHLLIHLCLHLSIQHRFDSMFLFRDAKEVLRFYKSEIEWSYFVDCAKRWKVATYMFFSLLLIERVCDVKVPIFVLQQLRTHYFSGRLLEQALIHNDVTHNLRLPRSLATCLFPVLRDTRRARLKAAINYPVFAAISSWKRTKFFMFCKTYLHRLLRTNLQYHS